MSSSAGLNSTSSTIIDRWTSGAAQTQTTLGAAAMTTVNGTDLAQSSATSRQLTASSGATKIWSSFNGFPSRSFSPSQPEEVDAINNEGSVDEEALSNRPSTEIVKRRKLDEDPPPPYHFAVTASNFPSSHVTSISSSSSFSSRLSPSSGSRRKEQPTFAPSKKSKPSFMNGLLVAQSRSFRDELAKPLDKSAVKQAPLTQGESPFFRKEFFKEKVSSLETDKLPQSIAISQRAQRQLSSSSSSNAASNMMLDQTSVDSATMRVLPSPLASTRSIFARSLPTRMPESSSRASPHSFSAFAVSSSHTKQVASTSASTSSATLTNNKVGQSLEILRQLRMLLKVRDLGAGNELQQSLETRFQQSIDMLRRVQMQLRDDPLDEVPLSKLALALNDERIVAADYSEALQFVKNINKVQQPAKTPASALVPNSIDSERRTVIFTQFLESSFTLASCLGGIQLQAKLLNVAEGSQAPALFQKAKSEFIEWTDSYSSTISENVYKSLAGAWKDDETEHEWELRGKEKMRAASAKEILDTVYSAFDDGHNLFGFE